MKQKKILIIISFIVLISFALSFSNDALAATVELTASPNTFSVIGDRVNIAARILNPRDCSGSNSIRFRLSIDGTAAIRGVGQGIAHQLLTTANNHKAIAMFWCGQEDGDTNPSNSAWREASQELQIRRSGTSGSGSGQLENPAPGQLVGISDFKVLLRRFIEILLAFAGVIAVIFLIVGGYQYIASRGNEEAMEKAKKTITGSVIGIVIIVISFAIVAIINNLLTRGP